jgi:hypothetical protein
VHKYGIPALQILRPDELVFEVSHGSNGSMTARVFTNGVLLVLDDRS